MWFLFQMEATVQPVGQSSKNLSSPTSTYSYVGHHTGSVATTETRDATQPESLYAQVERPARSWKKHLQEVYSTYCICSNYQFVVKSCPSWRHGMHPTHPHTLCITVDNSHEMTAYVTLCDFSYTNISAVKQWGNFTRPEVPLCVIIMWAGNPNVMKSHF